MKQFKLTLPLEVAFKPSGKYWIASCPRLDVRTQGETYERAEENLKEALALFLESCLTRGTLEEVLRQSGFTKLEIESVEAAAEPYLAQFASQPECHA